MNKKLFFGMFAAAGMLLATSCSNDELDAVQSGNEAQVTFSLATEGGIATRVISDGTGADILYYAIYNADKELITTISGSENGLLTKKSAFSEGSKTETVKVTLAKGQEYTAVFWAQNSECKAYTVSAEEKMLKVAMDYEGNNNDETRDAFFKAETFKVTGNADINVELKRPFAQINVGVTKADWDAAVESGVDITESKVVIKNAANSINLLDGTVSGEEEVTYDFSTIPAKFTEVETLAVDVNGDGTVGDDEKYKYLSMSYILTGADKTTLEADGLQFTFKSGTNQKIVFDEGLHAVPVQRNWRTNILGKLLTGEIDFTIVINPIYDNDYNYPEFKDVTNGVRYDAATKTYYLYSAAGLKWVAAQTNENNNNFAGYTVKLTSDVDLKNETWTPIGQTNIFKGIFDGGNNTISNLIVSGDNTNVGLFGNVNGTIKNVKLLNIQISGSHYAGGIVGYIYGSIENCHVDGGKIKVSVKDNDNGDKTGGIVGYVGEGNYTLSGNSVKNLKIEAYRDIAGIAGCIQTNVKVENNTVDNVTVTANMLQDGGQTATDANAAEIVGRNIANADLSTNTYNNVTVNVYAINNGVATVGSQEGILYAINNNASTINLTKGTYSLPSAAASKTLTISGTKETKISVTSGLSYASGANVTFKGLTIQSEPEGAGYSNGFASVKKTTFNNCVIDGTLGLYSSCEFNNCEFNIKGNYYNVWTWGAGTVTFKECTFNCDGKALSVYANVLDNDTNKQTVHITDCVFNDNGNNTVTGKAAIEISNTYTPIKLYDIFISNTTVNGFTQTVPGENDFNATYGSVENGDIGTNVWGNKCKLSNQYLNVVIDDVDVY